MQNNSLDPSANDNTRTLQTYQDKTDAYIAGTPTAVDGSLQEWIDASLAVIPAGGSVLEIGSGLGRDATYIQERGFDITCSDAVPNFIELLRGKGFKTLALDALKDPIKGSYNMVFADAVLLHFTPEEAEQVSRKVHDALASSGIFALRVKQGDGATWSTEKMDAPRYFYYWQEDDLRSMLQRCGFTWLDIISGQSTHHKADWLGVIAQKVA